MKRRGRSEFFSKRRKQLGRAREVLDECAAELAGRRRSGRVTARLGEVVVEVRYHTGDVPDYHRFADPEEHRYLVIGRLRWTSTRVSVRRTRPLVGDRALHRLRRQLDRVSERQAAVVVDTLTDLDGPIRLTSRHLSTQLTPDATAGVVVARCRRVAETLDRLAAAA
jgi:hypothetical protein